MNASNSADKQTEAVNGTEQEFSAQTEENLQDKLQADEKDVRKAANFDSKEAEKAPEMAAEGVSEPQNTVASAGAARTNETETAYESVPGPAPEPDREQGIASSRETAPIPASLSVSEPVKRQTRASEAKVLRDVTADDNASAKSKGSSRYEKEKFLLLDIRGYRDYVEHMAKAANMSATKYIRNLIQQDMDMNMDIYEAHKALEEKLKGRVTR